MINSLICGVFASTCLLAFFYFGRRKELLWFTCALVSGFLEGMVAVLANSYPAVVFDILLVLCAPLAYLLAAKAISIHFGPARRRLLVTIPALLISSAAAAMVLLKPSVDDYAWRIVLVQIAVLLPLCEAVWIALRVRGNRHATLIAVLLGTGALVFAARIPLYFILLGPGFTRADVLASPAFGTMMVAITVLIPSGILTFLSSIATSMIAEYRHHAERDMLSGIANRRAFEARYDELSDGGGVLLIADIDHFKSINDTHGHAAGDSAIRHVASVLSRSGVVCGRIGGEEFAIFLPGATSAMGRMIGEGLRTALECGTVHHGDLAFRLTASFGMTQCGEREPLEKCFARADKALYAAKASGRNRVKDEATAQRPFEANAPAASAASLRSSASAEFSPASIAIA